MTWKVYRPAFDVGRFFTSSVYLTRIILMFSFLIILTNLQQSDNLLILSTSSIDIKI